MSPPTPITKAPVGDPTVNPADLLRLAGPDAYLGPAATRFFGSGYRRMRYAWGHLRVSTPDGFPDARSDCTVAVIPPPDWSIKQAAARPHLSTIDAIVLGVRLAEAHLGIAFGLDAPAGARMWLRRVDIRAGSRAVEDTLAQVAVSATIVSTDLGQHCSRSSVLDVRVASMRLRVEIEHDGAPVPMVAAVHPAPSADSRWLYGTGFAAAVPDISGIEVDRSRSRATADVRLDPGAPGTVREGLGAAYPRSIGPVDGFVVTLQLGQILLYEMDRMPRQLSSTLWMRRTTVVCDRPGPVALDYLAQTELVNPQVLRNRSGRWRVAEIVGRGGGVNVTCSVTHRLGDTEND